MQQRDARREPGHQIELMAHQQNRATVAGQRVQQFKHGHLVRDIEKGSRFVEHECVATLGKRAGDSHTLPFAAGELVGTPTKKLGRPRPLNRSRNR